MDHLVKFRSEIMAELEVASRYQAAEKDIILIVHDQLPFVKDCIESIEASTKNYQLYVWDNGSRPETLRYLLGLNNENRLKLWRSFDNIGFIIPNNRLVSMGRNPYVILLNSDTRVSPGWDEALIAHLQSRPTLGAVGYQGSCVNDQGEGGITGHGEEIDYVCGWCLCMPRPVAEAFGPFDEEHLRFAYGEDSDLSFRLRESGYGILSLHLELVQHFENQTVKSVHREMGSFIESTFRRNHDYIRDKWAEKLAKKFPGIG